VVGLVARWDTERDGKREKRILPASRGEDGLWRFTGMQDPRPLYALPEVLAVTQETMIFVVEGEKAADGATSFLHRFVLHPWRRRGEPGFDARMGGPPRGRHSGVLAHDSGLGLVPRADTFSSNGSRPD